MNNVGFVNSLHLDYLKPLLRWKIVGVQGLFEFSNYVIAYTNFCRILRDLEKLKVVVSFRDPWTKKKYIALTELGTQILGGHYSKCSLDDSQWYHEAKVSDISRYFVSNYFIEKAELEHELPRGLRFYPDASLMGIKKGQSIKVALEVELVQKSKGRILSKVNHYLNSDEYDFALYFFCVDSLASNYRKAILEQYGESAFNRIMLVHNNTLQSKKIDFSKTKAFFQNKEVSFEGFFGGK